MLWRSSQGHLERLFSSFIFRWSCVQLHLPWVFLWKRLACSTSALVGAICRGLKVTLSESDTISYGLKTTGHRASRDTLSWGAGHCQDLSAVSGVRCVALRVCLTAGHGKAPSCLGHPGGLVWSRESGAGRLRFLFPGLLPELLHGVLCISVLAACSASTCPQFLHTFPDVRCVVRSWPAALA